VAVVPTPEGGEVVAGFATLIRLFAWPDACRHRLSQVLVFPPLQRRGVAAALLGAVRSRVAAAGGLDFSVEDPTDALQRLREVADVRAARQLPPVAAAAVAAVRAAAAAADAPARAAALALPPAVVTALREAVRACKPQARVIWEALLYLAARVRLLTCVAPLRCP
jgi:histone acetyltransferase 1